MKAVKDTFIRWRVFQPLKCVCRLLTAFFLLGILIVAANAESTASRSAQSGANGLMGKYWGGNSSTSRAPPSVRPKRKPISGSHDQQGTDKPRRSNTSAGSAARTGASNLRRAPAQHATPKVSAPTAQKATTAKASRSPTASNSPGARSKEAKPTRPSASVGASPERSGTARAPAQNAASQSSAPNAPKVAPAESESRSTGSSPPSGPTQGAGLERSPMSVPEAAWP
jgi:hypothetical protein